MKAQEMIDELIKVSHRITEYREREYVLNEIAKLKVWIKVEEMRKETEDGK